MGQRRDGGEGRKTQIKEARRRGEQLEGEGEGNKKERKKTEHHWYPRRVTSPWHWFSRKCGGILVYNIF